MAIWTCIVRGGERERVGERERGGERQSGGEKWETKRKLLKEILNVKKSRKRNINPMIARIWKVWTKILLKTQNKL